MYLRKREYNGVIKMNIFTRNGIKRGLAIE